MSYSKVTLYILNLLRLCNVYDYIFNSLFYDLLQLHLFSLQILHCENTFSAKGLSIDATLLTAVSNRSFALRKYMLFILFLIFLDDG